ncbi:hypothetical protein Ndes2526A_g01947 [Nannochloris sp. 'desiccata']
MTTRGNTDDPVAGEASNILIPHHQVSDTAAYSRGNLARLFVGRSEARSLSQVEHALLEYNKANNTSYTVLPNLLVRFRNQNKYHLRFITRLIDPSSSPANNSTQKAATMAPSCTTEQYNVVLQPSESLIIPVSGFSNDNSVKDSAAWSRDGAQETAPLERIMDQHALILTVYDVAHAAWNLESTLVRGLPTLLKSLNDLAAIRKLAAEIELAGDDDNARADGEQARQRQGQVLPDELQSLIRFATKPPTEATPKTATTATAPTIIKIEPGLHQAKTGPTAKVSPSITGTTTTRNNDKQLAKPNILAPVAIKQEPIDNSKHRGPIGAARALAAASKPLADKNTSKTKKSVPLQPQKSTFPSTKGAGSLTQKSADVEKKRKQQEMDFAEKKRGDAIAWHAQPSHPKDQPLLVNTNKRQKKETTPPTVVKTMGATIDKESKNKVEIGVPPITAGITPSRYKDLFNNVPNTAATYINPSMGAGNALPPVRNITRLVPRHRPPLERPRYIINTALNTGEHVPAPIPRQWEHILTRWHGVDLTTFSGEILVRPISEAPQAPPPDTGFSSWFDSMHDVEPIVVPPLDEDIDRNARVTSIYFDELNPTIKTYGVFPECTVKIPAMVPVNGEADVVGNAPTSNLGCLDNGHIRVVQNGVTTHHPEQKQKPHPSKNAEEDGRGRCHSLSIDYHSRSDEDDDHSDEYGDDSRSRSTYSRSRSRSYTRSRSRSLSIGRNFQQGTELLPPNVWNDFFKNEPNRPRPSHCQLERPSECIWQLESSSRVTRSSVQWQEKCFDPVWRYEMRLQAFLIKMKNRSATAECIFDRHPLPEPYNQDFDTFSKFVSSRSHLFHTATVPRGYDTKNALIRLRDGASCLLEWKRRMLDYIKVEGRQTGFRVPLAEALLACPFPRDALEEEVKDAQSNIHSYIVSKLGDAVYVIQPKMWTNATISYPTIELRFYASTEFRFPKRCPHGLACSSGPFCPLLHVPQRNWGRPLHQAPPIGGNRPKRF